jgi:hypothetical protein
MLLPGRRIIAPVPTTKYMKNTKRLSWVSWFYEAVNLSTS